MSPSCAPYTSIHSLSGRLSQRVIRWIYAKSRPPIELATCEGVAMDGRVSWINTTLPDWISSMKASDYMYNTLQGRCHGLGVEGVRIVKMRWLVLR